jgi:enoyl-CoA hydratase
MSYQFLNLTKDKRILTFSLSRPPTNPINGEFGLELFSAFSEVAQMEDVSVVVITSTLKKVFCSGADLKQMAAMNHGDAEAFSKLLQNINNLLSSMKKVVIAAINGHALGSGCELALACDFRLMAAGKSQIGLPEATLGILPGGGGTQRLPRLIGLPKALDMLLHGRTLIPDEALAIGLIDRIFPADSFMDEVMAFAGHLATGPGKAFANIKAAVHEGFDLPLGQALAVERRYGLENLLTRDAKEGLNAFVDKRKPKFLNQ